MKKSYRDVAAELRLNVKTVYRVLNHSPHVSPETRDRVIDALNRNGFFDARRIGREKVVIDVPPLDWSARVADRLCGQLDRRIFELFPISRENTEPEFYRQIEQAATVVHLSDPPVDVLEKVREANPDVVQINLFGNASGDITLGEDHYLGGKLAAQHVWDAGCRKVHIVSYDRRSGHRNRADAFAGELTQRHPGVEIRRTNVEDRKILPTLFSGEEGLPDVVFASSGHLGNAVYQVLTARGLRVPEDLSLLIYDGPGEANLPEYPTLDAVEFNLPQVIDLAEYYITKRPLLKHRGPFISRVAPWVVVRGSVKIPKKREEKDS